MTKKELVAAMSVNQELAKLKRLWTLWENCQFGVIITVMDEARSSDLYRSGQFTTTEETLKAFEEVVCEALKAGEKVQLVGFGSFDTATRSARTMKNIQTGETFKTKATVVPKFKAGAVMKEFASKAKKKKK